MSALTDLCRSAGLQIDWEDADGAKKHVSEESQRQVLAALGYPAETEAELAESLERRRMEERDCRFLSADLGTDILLASPFDRVELETEDGRTHSLSASREEGGLRIRTSAVDTPGYHLLRIGGREIRLALAPPRCFRVADAARGQAIWGPSVQLPSLLDEAGTGFGDFGTLARASREIAKLGADAVAISPTHALFPADPDRFSPYAPSSRLFLNILFGDPRLIGGPPASGDAGELIDWQSAIPAKLAALRAAFAECGEGVGNAVADYRRSAGQALERHATFDALHGHFFPQGARGWQDWPDEFHDPSGEAVARFAASHADEVDFFVFAQWLARQSLGSAQETATASGMAVGLIADLAVGMDGGGSHAWSHPDELLTGLSIGAPPDPLGPLGQDWGLTGFSPFALRRSGFAGFIETLRASLERTGGIRIDHVLGLQRLWLIPQGANSSEGAYVSFPLDDMLRVLAIESHRASAIVIGEDLGTVPPGLRPRLEKRGVLGMEVLWFQKDAEGRFTPPATWRAQAVSMTGTHDLPTVAGWWKGRDLDWAWKLGRRPPQASEVADREQRDLERAALWQAFRASGAAKGDAPAVTDPAPAVDAALAHVACAPGDLTLLPLEDLLGLEEQPNLPGTTDQHPNWRRRTPETAADFCRDRNVRRRARLIGEART